MRFWTETTNTGEIYFDNIEIEASTEEFVNPFPEQPTEPEQPDDDDDNPYSGGGNVSDSDWT